MKTTRTAAALLAAALLPLAYGAAAAAERRAAPVAPPSHHTVNEQYLFGQAGLFDPSGDDGHYVGGGLGSRVNDMVAVELGLSTYGTEDHGADVTVVPILAGVRLIWANPVVEPYAGLGAGLYYTDVEHAGDDYSFGGQASLGIDAWVSPKVAVNAEFRYHLVDPNVDGWDVDADGPSFSIGVRVGL